MSTEKRTINFTLNGRAVSVEVALQWNMVEMLQNSVDKSKMGDEDKSSALKRLHKMAVTGETKGTPIEFLQDLIDHEWNHAESSGGKTFMGNVVKGLTRKIMDTQNPVLYGKSND